MLPRWPWIGQKRQIPIVDPHFPLRIGKGLAISPAPRVDHRGRDRTIQFLALLNVRGASNVMWEWNASQAQRHAVEFYSSFRTRSLQRIESAPYASKSHRAISRQAVLVTRVGRCVGPLKLEDLSRSLVPYQSPGSCFRRRGGHVLSDREIFATVHYLPPCALSLILTLIYNFEYWDIAKHPASVHTAGGKP